MQQCQVKLELQSNKTAKLIFVPRYRFSWMYFKHAVSSHLHNAE